MFATNRRRIFIFVAVAIVLGTLFYFGTRQPSNNGEKTYKDPNNGEVVIDETQRTPENAAEDTGRPPITITGRSELINQGLTKDTVDYLESFFHDYNDKISYVSIVTNSVVQTRDNPSSDFVYTFQIQIDRKEYYTMVITSKDSENGVVQLYSKDKKNLLKEQVYYTPADGIGGEN